MGWNDQKIQGPNLWGTWFTFSWQDFLLEKTRVYKQMPAGEITIAVIVYDEDKFYGRWLNTQRQHITNDWKTHWETQLVFPKPYNINYHILAYGSTLNYSPAIIRLLMQFRIGLSVNLAYILSNMMDMQHLESLLFWNKPWIWTSLT